MAAGLKMYRILDMMYCHGTMRKWIKSPNYWMLGGRKWAMDLQCILAQQGVNVEKTEISQII